MKKLVPFFLTLTIITTSCATLGQLALKPSTFETIMALRNILDSSAFKALKSLKTLNDEGALGLLPDEIKPVLGAMKTLGYGDQIDNVTKQIGNISGLALKESEGIVSDAIKEVSFGDAVSVVLGGEDAATEVLRNAMYATVKKRYSSQVDNMLAGTDAGKYWPIATGAYNMFASNKVDSNLSDFMAETAVDALFLTMGKEEKKIRNNYQALGDQVVNKVFDYYVGGKK